MAGYTRQSSFSNGSVIDATDFEDEYNALQDAFNGSSGHTHDGTAGNGPPIESLGPSQDLVVTSTAVRPKTTNTLDIGTSTVQFKDGYFDGTLNTDVLVVDETSTLTGAVTAGDTLDVAGATGIDGDFDINTNKFTVAAATGNTAIAGTLDVTGDSTLTGAVTAGDTLDVAGNTGIDGDFDINTSMFTVASATGNTVIAGTLDVTGAVTLSDTLDVTGNTGIDGNFDINTDKVTIEAATGNTVIAGTLDVTGDTTLVNLTATGTADITGAVGIDGNLDIGTTQFTVDASNGNTAVAGTLDVTGDTTFENLTVNGNTVLGDAITDTVTINTNATTHSVIPATDSTYDLGDSSTYWQHGYIDAITTTGDVGVGGNVTITGDLTVSGTTTTVNSTTVDIADLNITLASNAATAAAANGGGITVAGASATLTYDSTTDRWDMNKDLEVANVYSDLTGDVKASDGTVVLDAGDGIVAAAFTGNVTGNLDGIVGGTTPAAVTGTTVQFNTGLTDGTTTVTGFADEDDMVSDSATLIPTQQSVKAYVDNTLSSGSGTVAASTVEATTVDATTLDLGGGAGAGWTITQNTTTNNLEFSYNGVVQAKLTSTGTFQVNDDVEAEAF